MSASSNLADSWLSVIPSPGLNLHLEKAEFQAAIKWWLSIDMFGGIRCPSCTIQSLDPSGHHALKFKYNGDVVYVTTNLGIDFLKPADRLVLVVKWR